MNCANCKVERMRIGTTGTQSSKSRKTRSERTGNEKSSERMLIEWKRDNKWLLVNLNVGMGIEIEIERRRNAL